MSSSQDKADSPARGAYHLFLGNFSFTILVALSAFIIARLLGPSGYGLYSLALVLPTYLYTIIQLGASSAAVYFAAKYRAEGHPERAQEFIYSVTLFQVILALASILVLLPFSPILASKLLDRPELAAIVPIALVTVLGHVTYYTVTGGLQGLSKMDRSAGLQVVLALVRLFSSAGLVLLGLGVLGAVLGNLLGFAVAGGLGMAIVLLLYGRVVPRQMMRDVRQSLTYAMPIYIASLIGGLVVPFQNTLLANFTSNQVIGWYNGATNLSTLVTVFSYPIGTALFPLFTTYANDKAKLLDIYRVSVRYSTMILVPITMFVISLSAIIAPATLGRSFIEAGVYLRVVVVTFLFMGVGALSQSALLNSMRRRKEWMYSSLIGSAITAGMSVALISLWGVYAVLVGTVVGQVCTTVVAWRMIGRSLGGNIVVRTLWKLYLASAIASAAVYPVVFLPLHPILVLLIGLFVFLAVLIPLFVYTRAVSLEDVERLDSYFHTIRLVYFFFRPVKGYYFLFAKRSNSTSSSAKA